MNVYIDLYGPPLHENETQQTVRLPVGSVGKKLWKKFHKPLEKIATPWNIFKFARDD